MKEKAVPNPEEIPQDKKQHANKNTEKRVLAPHEHHGATMDGVTYLGDFCIPGRIFLDLLVDEVGDYQSTNAEQCRHEGINAHAVLLSSKAKPPREGPAKRAYL